jgi:hypothetical protein
MVVGATATAMIVLLTMDSIRSNGNHHRYWVVVVVVVAELLPHWW